MKTTINNDLRVFQVLTSNGKQVFCNLHDLNQVINDLGTHAGYLKINHFWNNKPEKVSKKYLKELFEVSGVKQEFYY